MLRVRFYTKANDYRPVCWPIKHPYWCSGKTDDSYILVAYADTEEEIFTNWPEAYDLDIDDSMEYHFSGRFPKPEWFNN